MNKNTKTLTYLINLSFFLYFAILLVERVLSVSLSFANGIDIFADAFNGYTYLLVFGSVAGFVVYLLVFCRPNIKALVRVPEDLSFRNLCIASGILLLSGMVHTECTTPVIQFVSYGILIVGILLEVILNLNQDGDKVLRFLSFAYLVAFSMAIPVMYRSNIDLRFLFHFNEALASVGLVGVFTYLMILTFDGKDDLFLVWPIVAATLIDALLIALRWHEEANVFVLIFISLSVVLFAVGFLYKMFRKKKN